MDVHKMAKRSENYRVRQVHRYLKAWREVQTLLYGNNPPDTSDVSGVAEQHVVPKTSSDKALTAFAQLATLRLNVTRAVISLVDSDTQYILAEATQTISLMKDSRHDLGDELAFANLTLPRRDSICARVFDSTVTIPNATGQEQSIDAFVVQDALENETVKHNEMVQKQRVRFFASVPIVTLEGVKIGAYSVMSGKQRSGLTFAEYQFLQDVSSTVFEHLVLVRDRLNSVRGAKMVEGLTEFVGRSENSASVYTASESSPRGDMSEQMDHHISSSDDDKLESSIRDPLRRRRPRSIQASIPDEPQSKNSSLENSLQGNPLLVDENARISHSLNKLPTISTIETDLKRMFRQAAKALQVSTEANGCIFIEASFGDMRKDSPHVDHNRQAFDTAGRLSPRNAVFDREGKSESSLESQHETQSDSDGSKTSDANDSPRKQANVLGSSFFMRGKIQTDSGFPSFVCTEQDLQRCIHRYPRGKIFNFSGEGTISSGDDTLSDRTISTKPSKPALSGSGVSSQKRNRNQSRVRRFVAGELTKIIPDVKSVIFLPLWDFTQGRWHSGLFLWTTELGRLMDTNDEFPYIRAFGNTIMNEVSRLDAVHAERAKTTFIASISHELRSPLHGILGSTEFMLDTNLDSFQRGLIASVETCGKTLLDTIDHVLDYAKINYFGTLESQKGPTRSRRSQRSSRSQLGSVSHTNRTSTFNICILVEEVVEAVFAGQTFKDSNASTHVDVFDDHTGSSTTKTKRNDAQRSRTLNQSGRFRDGMTVVLNIDMNIDCTIISQPGALRRVVMNLFGNALKYSHAGKGLVEVTLRRSTKPARRTQGRASIEIVITDTGRGMSADYLRNKLYRPFSQEDPFSVGTGLGLSIVRQIVTSLNGNIQIESEQGKGTEITVNLDLPSIEPTEDRTQRPSISKTTRGLKICILEPGELEPSTEQARTHMVDALQGVLSTWFGMTVSTASTPEESKADFYVYPEPPSIEILLKEQDSKDKSIDQKSQRVPLIIVCTNAFEEAALKFAGLERLTTLGWRIEVISQPCGPLKLAKVFEAFYRDSHDINGMINSPSHTSEIEPNQSPSTMDYSEPRNFRPQIMHNLSSDDTDAINNAISKEQAQRDKNPPIEASDYPVTILRPQQRRTITDTSISSLDASEIPSFNQPSPYVLLVDDNGVNLQLLVAFMNKLSLRYARANNGLEAFEAYKERALAGNPFDYVLMDINMPVMDGLTSTKQIRNFERQNSSKKSIIAALTGMAGQSIQEEAFQIGFDHYFSKPVRFKELKRVILGD